MKKNPISAIAGWKSAALLALVAMVATVAFSGVLSTTQSATAQTAYRLEPGASQNIEVENGTAPTNVTGLTFTQVTEATADDTKDTYTMTADRLADYGDITASWQDVGATAASDHTVTIIPVQAVPGQTVTVFVSQVSGTSTVYRISADSTASGSFVANPGRSFIICADSTETVKANQGCDVDDSNADDAAATDQTGRDAAALTRENVSGQVGLQVKVAADSARGTIFITQNNDVLTERAIQVSPAPVATGLAISPGALGLSQSSTAGSEDVTITVTNNRGLPVAGQLVTVSTTLGQFTNAECPNLPVCRLTTLEDGTATVMLRGDNRSGSATVTASVGTLSRTASATFFGLAASLDAAAATGAATVDQGKSAFVILSVADKDGNPVEGSNPGSSVTTEVPNPVVVSLDNTVEYEGTPSPADNVQACSSGTNAAGKCAVEVTAAPNASRGIHTMASTMTVNVPGVGPTVLAASIDIRVVGPPASIETDAPAQSSPSTEIPISVSVYDDEGDLVGAGSVTVILVQGRGAVLGTADGKVNLVNGTGSFSYYATSNDDVVAFRLSTGAPPVVVIHEIAIGAAAEEAPEAPLATWNNELVSGQNLVVWNGEDGADPSAGSDMGVSAIWSYNTGSGTWDGYFPNAADVPGGNTLTSLSNGDAYFVIVE